MESTFQEALLQSYTPDELLRHIRNSPSLTPTSIRILSNNLLAKYSELDVLQDTVKAIEMARQLGVRVPDIKRTVESHDHGFCIMHRIPGSTLESVWTQLSWFQTIILGIQLRYFVWLLKSLTSSVAGSPVTGECRSFWLEDRYQLPARSSPEVVASFIAFWVGFTSIAQARKIALTGGPSPPVKKYIPPTPKTFVFTHHDLAPRNLVIDPKNRLWLVDWEYGGWYPEYFEYAAMYNFQILGHWDRQARFRWSVFTWIAIGCFELERRMLESIRSKFTSFYVGRRFDILENGGPCKSVPIKDY